MCAASDPSGTLQLRIAHVKWFTTLTLHVFLKLLVGISLIHTRFSVCQMYRKIKKFRKKSYRAASDSCQVIACILQVMKRRDAGP